jgi:hypothetical protein
MHCQAVRRLGIMRGRHFGRRDDRVEHGSSLALYSTWSSLTHDESAETGGGTRLRQATLLRQAPTDRATEREGRISEHGTQDVAGAPMHLSGGGWLKSIRSD